MEQTHHLSELSGLVAAIRTQGRTVRLVVRNVDRLGLLHLYFVAGRLAHVEGHAGSAAMALRDLATWFHGAIRLDAVAAPTAQSSDALDSYLDLALKELEMRGVVYPAPPVVVPNIPARMPTPSGPSFGARGLPPLETPGAEYAAPRTADAPLSPPIAVSTIGSNARATVPAEYLSDPQWHLLALAVRQITESVAQIIGTARTDGLLRQALAQASPRSTFLAGLEIDETGWLRAREEGFTGQFPHFDAAEAVADLLAAFEASCGTLLGATRVREVFATAIAPLRASLAQIGLVISDAP